MLEGEAVTILHICDGWERSNGAANIARMIAGEQAALGSSVGCGSWYGIGSLRSADEVWIHCAWKPCLWWAALWGRNVHWMPEASYDPVRLRYHGWKKRLAGPIERFFLRRADVVVATCEAEAAWIRAYEPRAGKVEVTDIRRFFNLRRVERMERVEGRPLHLLYLGRRHPLKGVRYLEAAVEKLASTHPGRLCLRVVSDAFGEEKKRMWDWCDVLVLPTLSENFGLVVAEALERGKRVVTTDGAPAWEPCGEESSSGKWKSGYGGRLLYLLGYRDGTDAMRVESLEAAICSCLL